MKALQQQRELKDEHLTVINMSEVASIHFKADGSATHS
jgi:hypothetical protein